MHGEGKVGHVSLRRLLSAESTVQTCVVAAPDGWLAKVAEI